MARGRSVGFRVALALWLSSSVAAAAPAPTSAEPAPAPASAPAGASPEASASEPAAKPKAAPPKAEPAEPREVRPVPAVFALAPADRLDPYGPRPPGVPKLSREQILTYGLENPLVAAAGAQVEAMEALLLQARFAWVPVVKTTAAIAPGVATTCEDLQIQLTDPTTNTSRMEDFQYCRPRGGVDIDTLGGYFQQLAHAGVTIRFSADTVVPIYTFGKIKSAKGLASAGVALARLNVERMRQETALRVYQAHATLLLARESIAILEESWKVITDARLNVERDLGMGENPDEEENLDRDPADLTRIELGELEVEDRLLEARKIESLALAALWAIAGEAAPPGFDVAETTLVADTVAGGLRTRDYYREVSAGERPEALLASGAVEARKAAERLARANFLPDIGLIVSAGVGYSSTADPSMRALYYYDRYNYSRIVAALGMNWSLDFHNHAFKLKKARAERRAAEHDREAALLLLGLEVDKAYRELLQAQRAIELTAAASKKARQLVVDLQVKETVGGGNLKELQRALTSWAEWRFRHIQAVMRHNVALASLARAVGIPLVAPPQ